MNHNIKKSSNPIFIHDVFTIFNIYSLIFYIFFTYDINLLYKFSSFIFTILFIISINTYFSLEPPNLYFCGTVIIPPIIGICIYENYGNIPIMHLILNFIMYFTMMFSEHYVEFIDNYSNRYFY
jgi:hypothetical protein